MSPTGELFTMAGVWTAVALGVAYFIRAWPWRVAFVVAAVGIPFWELPYGYYNLVRLCKEEGGLQVFEAISPQSSICADYPFDTSANLLLANGMRFVEARSKDGVVTRLQRGKAMEVMRATEEKVTSNYCVTHAWVGGLPWRIRRGEYVLRSEPDRRVVARHSDFVWSGTSWQRYASPILGYGGECRHRGPVSAIVSLTLKGSN